MKIKILKEKNKDELGDKTFFEEEQYTDSDEEVNLEDGSDRKR
jgi:hypothetical protein